MRSFVLPARARLTTSASGAEGERFAPTYRPRRPSRVTWPDTASSSGRRRSRSLDVTRRSSLHRSSAQGTEQSASADETACSASGAADTVRPPPELGAGSEGLDALAHWSAWKPLAQPAGRRPSRWTGAARAPPAVDRKPEADYSSFRHVHVTYVIPADAPSRMEELASKIVTDLAAADAWWQREDPPGQSASTGLRSRLLDQARLPRSRLSGRHRGGLRG